MGITAGILFGAGTAWSAGSQWKAGDAQRQAFEYNAKVADQNAAIDQLRADDAVSRGLTLETIQRKNVRQFIGSQRAALAANGVDVNDGSAVDVTADSAYYGELDALTIRTNAAREAWGYSVDKMNDQAEAQDLRTQGKMAQRAGRVGAVGTILTGGASYAMDQYGFSNSPRTKQIKAKTSGVKK